MLLVNCLLNWPTFSRSSGGYTRILKCGFRAGDNNAPMAYIELVGRPVDTTQLPKNKNKPGYPAFWIRFINGPFLNQIPFDHAYTPVRPLL